MKYIAFTDGAARGNPGESGIGVLITNESGERVGVIRKYIGRATNNQAEYTAVLELLDYLQSAETLKCSEIVVYTDSELMARQLNGQYKVKDPDLKIMFENVKLRIQKGAYRFSIQHVPRSQNREADTLANEAIDLKS